MDKIILHVDMDAFFASVEQKCNPHLRGKPIAVVGANKRTVVTTSSYEARAMGVKTGMNKYEAKKVCPSLIIVEGDNRKYTSASTRIMEILKRFSPIVEVYSVDEAFMDLTGIEKLLGTPMEVGQKIKEAIKNEVGITASVGISDNKLMAKLASSRNKPDGLFVIDDSNKKEILEELPVKKLWGVGSKLSEHLNGLGVRTCGELGRFPVSVLRRRFGIVGERLHLMGQGIYNDSVVAIEKEDAVLPKSIGHSATLASDIDHKDLESIKKNILKLTDKVARRARGHDLVGRKVSLDIRYWDFDSTGKQKLMTVYTNDTKKIYKNCLDLLEDINPYKPIRLLGVSISSIRKDFSDDLFETEVRHKKLLDVMDSVNSSFGSTAVGWGTVFEKVESSGVISPAWRPSGVRKVDVK